MPSNSTSHIRILLVVSGVVMVWRGIWGLLDTYLFPGHPALSYSLSIAIGLAILYLDDFRLDEFGHTPHKKQKG